MNPSPLTGKRILVTGVTGMVAGPMAAASRPDNTVYGAARFADPTQRESHEAAGITTIRVDLEHGDLDEVPADLDYVLHFAVAKTNDFARDLTANADGAAHLMERVQGVDAFFHCSSGGVYQEHEHDHLKEDAPLGDSHRAAGMESYSISKIAAETMVRYTSTRLGIPTVIARAQRAVRRHVRLAVLPRDDARARHGDPGAHRRTVAVQPAQPRRHRRVAPLPPRVSIDAGQRRELGRRRDRQRRGVVRAHRRDDRQAGRRSSTPTPACRRSSSTSASSTSSASTRRSRGRTASAVSCARHDPTWQRPEHPRRGVS